MAETRKRRREQKATETTILDLPPDALRQIRTRLSNNDRLSFWMVCKSFRTISDGFVRSLIFNFKIVPSTAKFRKLFTRFSSVTRIVFDSAHIVRALNALADSGLKIEELIIDKKPNCLPSQSHMTSLSSKLGDIKILTLRWLPNFRGMPVVDFIHIFKSLEELELCGRSSWSDVEIEKLPVKATHLRKINLSYNYNVTNASLDALLNCVNLEHISIEGCTQITIQGFCAFVREKRNLKSLVVPNHFQDYRAGVLLPIPEVDVLTLADGISCCENLIHLSILGGLATDAFLSAVAMSHFPLASLAYKHSGVPKFGYTMAGVSAMLCAFRGLTKLDITLPLTGLDTQDMEMSQLVQALVHLKDVTLASRTAVYATLFSLIHNCPLLEFIHIDYWWGTNTRFNVNMPQMIRKNYSIKQIRIFPEADITIKTALTSICPSLKRSPCMFSIYPVRENSPNVC